MEYGGITPIGLPADWSILIDSKVIATELVVIGSGMRKSKIVLHGEVLKSLSSTLILEKLGK